MPENLAAQINGLVAFSMRMSPIKDQVDPTLLGVSYYLAVINVPAMVVVHVMIFAYLLKRR